MTTSLGDDLHFFYGTLPQPCPYLPDRMESKVVTELAGDGARDLHEGLSRAGFRRSHGLAYKPAGAATPAYPCAFRWLNSAPAARSSGCGGATPI